MKVVICGKGGSGKSTITAMLAREFVSRGRDVLVVDTDESNTGLNSLLGTDEVYDLMDYLGGREEMTKKIRAAAPDYASIKFFEDEFGFDSLPGGYFSENKGVKLVSVGKIHEAGEGCACPMGMLARQFIAGIVTGENDIVIVDTEAGIEHFGRGIDSEADVVLMVIDPSFESVKLAEKISRMSDKAGISVHYVLNKWDDDYSSDFFAGSDDLSKVICRIAHNPEIISAGFSGSIPENIPDEITELAGKVVEFKAE